MNMTIASQKPIDLDNLVDEDNLADELEDATTELRAIGMHSLANSVAKARRMLRELPALPAPPESGTFDKTGVSNGADVAEFALKLEGVR